MLNIEFSFPFWGKVEIQGTEDLFDMVELTHTHSDEKDIDRFSRLYTTAYLLLTVAFSFFQAFPLGIKVILEGTLHCYDNKIEQARAIFYDCGAMAFKHLIFAVHQLFLAFGALVVPSQVRERVILHKPLSTHSGIFSRDPEHVTNQLIHQITALRNQNALLRSQMSIRKDELVSQLLDKHEKSETHMADTLYRVNTELQLVRDTVEEKNREIEELLRQNEQQEMHCEERVQDIEEKLEEKSCFWEYVKQELQNSWKDLCGKDLVDRIAHIENRPHMYLRTLKH